jgi:SUKH-3 immunity protein
MRKPFSASITKILKDGGWYEGRHVADTLVWPSEYVVFDRAFEILDEFGGLHIGKAGEGINMATSDVNFDSAYTGGLQSVVKTYEESLHTRLYPVADCHNSHFFLLADEKGACYAYSFDDTLIYFADSFEETLEMLLLGIRPPDHKGDLKAPS